MKKIIISLLVAAFLPLSASAYSYGGYKDVAVDITARGGYNFMENIPLAGGVIGVEFWGLRAELEAGWTSFNLTDGVPNKDFCYISPMIGCSYGFNHKLYAMIGFTNWGYVDYYYDEPMFNQDIICAKIKAGGNLFLNEHLFINIDLSYLFPKRMDDYCHVYKGFNLMGGIGFRF